MDSGLGFLPSVITAGGGIDDFKEGFLFGAGTREASLTSVISNVIGFDINI